MTAPDLDELERIARIYIDSASDGSVLHERERAQRDYEESMEPDVTLSLITRIRQLETINEGRRQLNEREHEVLDCAGIKPDATVMERISLLATQLRAAQAECNDLRDKLRTSERLFDALGDVNVLAVEDERLRAGRCAGVVTHTFVACSEGGHFCSETCRLRAELLRAADFLERRANSDFPAHPEDDNAWTLAQRLRRFANP